MKRIAFSLIAMFAMATPAAAEPVPAGATPDQIVAWALTDICIPEVFDGKRMEETAAGAGLEPVDPRRIGSTLNLAAWKIAVRGNKAYVERIKPTRGCSVAVEKGDAAALRSGALTLLGARSAFEPKGEQPTRGGRAVRSAYCSTEAFPYVVSIVTSQKSKPAFVLNLFRAESPRPSFCAAPM